ncbi:hypothetical protein B0H13DRAFT_1938304 [Mycena leptocephala]|nr:hypothetical protein B0H13DRAFT_1938304 [Mycena leptocephala]
MSTSKNPAFPPGIMHPSLRQRPPMGTSEEELALVARRYGQFKNFQGPSHAFSGSGYVPDVPPGRQPQQNAWEGTYDLRQAGPGHFPLQSMQASVAPVQWEGFIGDTGFYRQQNQQQFDHRGTVQNYHPRYSDVAAQYNGAPQHPGQPQPQYRGQPSFRGQPPIRGQPPSHAHRGQFHPRGSARPRGFAPQHAPPRHHFAPPDPEKTPTPKMPVPRAQRPKMNKENHAQLFFVHAWTDISEAPQPSGMYVPPPPPPVDLDLVAKVGDIVRVKPWTDQYTWIEGCVEKADFSVIKNHKPSPRYVVSYTDPASKQSKQRTFCPHLSEIMVKEPDEPGSQPLPEGTDRNIYACIPPPVVQRGESIEMIWAHARALTPADKNDQISIRILVAPSKNLLFDNFPIKYTLPFTRARALV